MDSEVSDGWTKLLESETRDCPAKLMEKADGLSNKMVG